MAPVVTYRPRQRLPIATQRIIRTPLFYKRFYSTFAFIIFLSAIPMGLHYYYDKDTHDKVAYNEFLKEMGINPIHGQYILLYSSLFLSLFLAF